MITRSRSMAGFSATPNVDPQALLSALYDTVEIRTNLTPTFSFRLDGPNDPATAALMRQLQPTIILRGVAGQLVLAPQGVAGDEGASRFASLSWKTALGFGAAILGGGLLIAAVARRF